MNDSLRESWKKPPEGNLDDKCSQAWRFCSGLKKKKKKWLAIPTGISAGNCLSLCFFSFLFLEGPNFTRPLPFPQGSPQSYSLHLPSFHFQTSCPLLRNPQLPLPPPASWFAKCWVFFFSPLWKAASQQLLTLNLHHDENKPANSTLQGRELRKRRQKPGLVSAPPRKSAALWSQEGAETLEGPIQWHHWAPSTY